MKIFSLVGLAALAVLVTGCPHNDYTVELTPRGQAVERRLDFYRADGVDSNGVPKYESFPTNELAAITALYPAGAVTQQGERHAAVAEFSGALPGDVGGAGEYHHFHTSLGDAGFYVERVRGTNDLAATASARMAAADQLTDLVLGWSRAEFGREPGYKNLRWFVDQDFRRDLKNFALYFWAGEIAAAGNTNATEEFMVRLGHYLGERGYLKREDWSRLAQLTGGSPEIPGVLLVQKLIAEKLGVPPSGPLPKPVALLADPVELDKSWNKFLTGTPMYRTQLKQWAADKKTKPDLEKPNPSEAVGELFLSLIQSGPSGESDHLTVRLKLAAAPDHTNGRWNETRRQVVWETPLEVRESARRLPVFCYASWSHPDEQFQQAHFGRVILNGDELLKYCLWHGGLSAAQAGEWEKLLANIQSVREATNQLAAFEFSAPAPAGAANFGRALLNSALERSAAP